MSTSTDHGTTPDHDAGPGSRPVSGRRGARRLAEIGVVVLALVAVVLVGISRVAPDGDDFCARVVALPSLRTDAATPADTLVAYAEGMDRVAAAAGDDRVAVAAGSLATYHRRLAAAIGSGPSSAELLDEVDSIDTVTLQDARATLDRAITQRCS